MHLSPVCIVAEFSEGAIGELKLDVFVEHPKTNPSWSTYDYQFAVDNLCGSVVLS